MLVYHPAFDLFHAMLRTLQILQHSGTTEMEVERMTITDFYFLFPDQACEISLPRAMPELRKLLTNLEISNPYESLPNSSSVFERIRPIQTAGFHCLAAYGLIDDAQLKAHVISRS